MGISNCLSSTDNKLIISARARPSSPNEQKCVETGEICIILAQRINNKWKLSFIDNLKSLPKTIWEWISPVDKMNK